MRRTAWLPVALAALVLTACGEEKPTAGGDEKAGSWRTWVLTSGSAISVPDPPDSEKAPKAADEEGTGPAVQPWLERAMTLVSRRPKDPVTASRNYSLVAVAMYDAAVAAAHWQAEYGGSYPSTDAAIAGAGSRVIAYAFPEFPGAQLDQDAEVTARELVDAGVASEASADAGLELGRAVAERVIAAGRADGSDRAWKGRQPEGTSWRPPPGSAARPVAPGAGSWRPWVLRSGRDVRPPAPPPYGSKAFRKEAQAVRDTDAKLTEDQKRIAAFWAGGDGTELPPGRWIKVTLEYLRHQAPISEVRAARIFALLTVAMSDAGIAAWDAKYAYWVTRPENAIRDLGIDRDWKPYLDTPFFPAFVSGHATYSGAAGEVMSYLFPDDADTWRARAREAADSRVYGGIHYPMDGEVGLRMGVEIGKRVVARAKADGAES